MVCKVYSGLACWISVLGVGFQQLGNMLTRPINYKLTVKIDVFDAMEDWLRLGGEYY